MTLARAMRFQPSRLTPSFNGTLQNNIVSRSRTRWEK